MLSYAGIGYGSDVDLSFFLLRLREVYPWSWNSEFLLWSSPNRVVRKDPIHIGVDMFVKELRLSTSFCPL